MSPRPFRLGRSPTGLGLFATRPIKKNLRISEYRGRRLGLDAAVKAEKSGNRYLYEVNSKITIDGAKHGNIARYFNHSCNPNCDTFIRNKRVFIRTLRNIKPDEELTYDYGRDYLKNVIGLENCKCSRCTKRRAKQAAELREKRKRKAARLARLNGKATAGKTAAGKSTAVKSGVKKTAKAARKAPAASTKKSSKPSTTSAKSLKKSTKSKTR